MKTPSMPTNPLFQNLIDAQFDLWRVVQYAGKRGQNHRWLCRCECGSVREVASGDLKSGRSTNCGCRQYASTSARLTKHGHAKRTSRTPEYMAWKRIIQRCTNPGASHFEYYGGRGICVCDRWRCSFENFLSDMGLMPGKRYTIERKHVNGDYEPDNCKWATMAEQNRNKRNNRKPKDGKCLSDIAADAGMHPNTLRARIDSAGMDIEQALSLPVSSPSFCGPHLITFRGKTQTISAWCRELKLSFGMVKSRIANGWSVDRALSTGKLTHWSRKKL